MTPTQKQRIAEIEERSKVIATVDDLRFLLELVKSFPSRLESTNCVAYAESTTEVIAERKEQPHETWCGCIACCESGRKEQP